MYLAICADFGGDRSGDTPPTADVLLHGRLHRRHELRPVDVDGGDDGDGLLGLVGKGPGLAELRLEPVANVAVLALKGRGHGTANTPKQHQL